MQNEDEQSLAYPTNRACARKTARAAAILPEYAPAAWPAVYAPPSQRIGERTLHEQAQRAPHTHRLDRCEPRRVRRVASGPLRILQLKTWNMDGEGTGPGPKPVLAGWGQDSACPPSGHRASSSASQLGAVPVSSTQRGTMSERSGDVRHALELIGVFGGSSWFKRKSGLRATA